MGVAMARIKLNADRLVGYIKTDSNETNASSFRRSSTSLIQLSPMFLGHESGESRIARYHESARCNTIGDVEKFVGPIAYSRMIADDHITRICKSEASIQLSVTW
jgi:hypothetical protein